MFSIPGYIAAVSVLNGVNAALSLTHVLDDAGWLSRAINVVTVVLLGWLFYVVFWRGSVVYRVHRRDAPSFIRRNRDALVVNGLVAAVSVLATYFVTR